MALPTVSVIMPAFNSEKTIEKALLSMCNQEYRDWECIVVDDGSTDNTAALARLIGDERIRVFSFKENMGRPYARQFALSEARGSYLAMLDSDDWITSDKLQRQVDFFDQHPEVDAVSGGMFIENEDGLVGVRGGGDGHVCCVNNPFSLNIPHAATMIRMSAVKGFDYDMRLRYSQDSDFLRRSLFGKKVVSLPDFFYCYAEWDSVGYKKVVKSFWYTSVAASKWMRSFPIEVSFRILKNIMKAALVQVFGMLGFFDRYLQARSINPSSNNFIKYNAEKIKLDAILASRRRLPEIE